MKIPKNLNLTESEILCIINRIVSKLAPLFRFGSYETEDIKQEGRLCALLALEKFDPLANPKIIQIAAKLEAFLFTHVRNRLINLKRYRLGRYKPPCESCQVCKKGVCQVCDDINECPKVQKWKQRNSVKKNLAENSGLEDTQQMDYDKQNLRREFMEIIDKSLPVAFRADYRRLIEGNKLPKQRYLKLIEIIKETLYEL